MTYVCTKVSGWVIDYDCVYCQHDAHVCYGCGAPLDHLDNTTDGHGHVWPHRLDRCYE